ASEHGLVALEALGERAPTAARAELSAQLGAPLVEDDHPTLRSAERQLQAFMSGRRRAFTVPLELRGTPFERRVWGALAEIPYGRTVDYRDIAARIGQPAATRAVAGACGRNPVIIMIPCHRVVAADGIGGFSPGLPLKRRLLALERGTGD